MDICSIMFYLCCLERKSDVSPDLVDISKLQVHLYNCYTCTQWLTVSECNLYYDTFSLSNDEYSKDNRITKREKTITCSFSV